MKQQPVAFHSSRGPVGSVHSTTDGSFYVRTPWGTMKLENNSIGVSITEMQRRHDWYMKRHRLTVLKVAGAFLAGFAVAALILSQL